MLTWMQHHKKYLIITIWVSVIAFVGAGFVGWGSYTLNPAKSNAVATVGDIKIGYDELNTKYSSLYNNYRLMDPSFNKEKAKELGLEEIAINQLIIEKLYINYAKDLGLEVSEDDILEKIASQELFYENGSFNKDTYYKVLKENGYTPKLYETLLKNELYIAKLFAALNIELGSEEIAMLSVSTSMQDKLKIALVKIDEKSLIKDEKEIKALWEKNKQNYKSKKSYIIKSYLFKAPAIKDEKALKAYYEENKHKYTKSNGEILSYELAFKKLSKDLALQRAKTPANKKFVELKNAKEPFQNEIIIFEDDELYPVAKLEKLKENELLKPFIKDDGYMIIKLVKINESQVKSFEEAKEEVLKQYFKEKRGELLAKKAKEELKKGFTGINTGFLNKASLKPENIDFLDQNEFSIFLAKLFDTNKIKSFVLFDEKAVIYEILDQKLGKHSSLSSSLIKGMDDYRRENAKEIKEELLRSELIGFLESRYKIIKYYKGREL